MNKMSDFAVVPRKDNKGFTIHAGENYVGYIVIGENKVPEDALVKLQNPTTMAKILANAELRPFAKATDNDVSYIDAILGGGETQPPVATSAEAFENIDKQNVS